ncbi:uncharacterized protein LOC109829696 [Asparagus officinalis]|uniref:uncharacterized protein LOC109829696 n=1 Tax=Asparagus officinalis TaxID=4686 RepID=UPI00098E6E97|nr:uncharacterized protein LOC109829696 [Asparagus officinalis]
MPKHKNPTRALAARAWRLLRLAFNRLRSLCTDHRRRSSRLHYGEHELSFDETPIFRFMRKHPHPFRSCADSRLDSLYDDGEDDDTGSCDPSQSRIEREVDRGDEGEIDVRAEEFISRFYGEIKLQRERSWLRYNEMLYRGMS